MAAVDAMAVSPEELQAKAWEGFAEGNWQKDIDVRDFIQKNYTPSKLLPSWLPPPDTSVHVPTSWYR